jgi:mono/diheme cytochrome c family protein
MPFSQRTPLRISRKRIVLTLLLSGVAMAAWWLWPEHDEGTPIADGAPLVGVANTYALAQGWSQQTRERASFTSFGSRLLPYDWFLGLEQAASSEPFRSNANLGRLGFLASAPSAANPAGLPVGFARTRDERGVSWIGLGCAACHTGQLRYRGRAIRIAGGAGLLDLDQFERELLASLQRTDADPAKFARFAARVLPPDRPADSLRAGLRTRMHWLQRRLANNRTAVPYGHGRMDAFGQIFNAVGVDLLDVPENVRAPDAPVSIPVLWSTPRMSRVQWNGSSPNDGIAPLVQNVTTALGVYGSVDLSNGGWPGYASSAEIEALGRIQHWHGQLRAPRWPQPLLGRIDAARAQRGRALYAQQCQGCHQLLDRNDNGAQVQVHMEPLDKLGTDPRMARNFATREGATAALQGRPALVFGGARLGGRARMIDIVVHLAVGATARHPWEAANAAVRGRQGVHSGPDPELLAYKARPLDGAWSSAPYLHNGSVPTLYDLLSPVAQRPRLFTVGSGEFDPVQVGLAAGAAGPGDSRFDAGLPGNGNGGHLYGTALDEGQRLDLLEFLKTL